MSKIVMLSFLFCVPLFASQTHSQRSFTYIINPIHTDCFFSSDEDGSAELKSHAISDTSSSTRQYYLYFSSNEMGTHNVSVSITPMTQSINGTTIAIPVTISVLDDNFSEVVDDFVFTSEDTGDAVSRDILTVTIGGPETVTSSYAFTYDFGEEGALDLYPAGTYSSTVTLTYSNDR